MSILADIYVASEANASEYDGDPARFKAESASWKRFTILELSMLWALLQGREWDVDLLDSFTNVLMRDGGERMIARLPDEFLYDVMAADEEKAAEAVRQWAATEELDCEPAQLKPFFNDLRRLADTAVCSGRGLYLWNCV
jgi:hypothetical protein